MVTRTFKRRRDANAYAALTEADRLRGVVIDPRRARITLGQYAEDWLTHRHHLSERTVELYRWQLDRKILPAFGSSAVGVVTSEAVRNWYTEIAKKTPSTAAKAYRLLSVIMRTAAEDGVIARNPCRIRGAGTEWPEERPIATVTEVQALAEAMPAHLQMAVLLASWCQLRRGEILGLRRQDVDMARRTLMVVQTRSRKMDGTTVVKGPKSKAGRRTIALPSNVVPPFEWHLDVHVDAAPDALIIAVPSHQLSVAWVAARRRVGRSDLRLHDLRHSGLTWAGGTGATVAELMRRAGHASPAAALRYQHATDARDRALADALAALAPPTPWFPPINWRPRQSPSVNSFQD
jgi:integrase